MTKTNTKQLCFNAVMVALFVALEYVSIEFLNLKITFSGLPIILSSLYFGPAVGGLVGFLGSGLSQLIIIRYGFGPTTIIWILPAVLRGVTVGLLNSAFKKSRKPLVLTTEIIISSIIVTAANTVAIVADANFYGYAAPAVLSITTAFRFVSGVLTAIVFSVIVPAFFKPLDKLLINNRK